jgi:dynamin 1-like protein
MTEIRDNIVGLTEKMCGKSNNIVDKPLVLQVYSHTCPDLTLIDLPGITRIPIEGQPENIE